MIPYILSALEELPELNQDDITAILNCKKEAVKVAVASFEIPSADKTFIDRKIEIYGKQTFGDIMYICFAPIVKGKAGPKEKAVWSLNADLFLQYASN